MEINTIVESQRAFFNSHQTLSYHFRLKMLKQLKTTLINNQSRIYQALYDDLNKSQFESMMSEYQFVLHELNHTIKHLAKWMQKNPKKTPLVLLPAKSYTIYEPLGVVLIISPWNYPFNLAMAPLIGAIASGNTVVLKTSRNSHYTSKLIEEIINQTFDSHYIHVAGESVSYDDLMLPKYDYIFFTGSPKVGKTIMMEASKNLTPVTLELGGKSPCFIDAHTNISTACKRIVWGKSLNAGQTCIAPDYLLVDELVVDKVIESLQYWYHQLNKNDIQDQDYPKIISEHHFTRLVNYIDHQADKIGGDYAATTNKIQPCIFKNVSFDDEIMQEEIFGPILPIITYKDIDETINYLLTKDKPLACYIFSNRKSYVNKILKDLSFGGGCVNDCIMHIANINLPFGGVGNSGMGKYHGYYSFKTFSNEKAIYDNCIHIDLPFKYDAKFKKLINVVFR